MELVDRARIDAGATTRRRLPVPSEHPHSYKGVGTDRTRSRVRVAGRVRPGDQRISFDGRFLLNPVEPSPPRHAVSCGGRSHGGRETSGSESCCCAAGERPLIPHTCGRGRIVAARGSVHARERYGCRSGSVPPPIAYSSRCSIPCLETFASVITSGIQSGLLSGASSSQAHPS